VSKRQEFDNGQEVEVYEGGKVDAFINAEYVAYDTEHELHVVWVGKGEKLSPICESMIRPAQLICEEAREKIKEFHLCKTEYICFPDSDEIMLELFLGVINENFSMSRAKKNGLIHLAEFKEHEFMQLDASDKKQLPELNLKTGEVIPCEPEKKIESCCHCYEMSQRLTEEQTKVDELTLLNADSRKCIVKLQEENAEQKRIIDGDLLARAEDRAEIEQLAKQNDELDNMHDEVKDRAEDAEQRLEQLSDFIQSLEKQVEEFCYKTTKKGEKE